jgi:hypothetical protein
MLDGGIAGFVGVPVAAAIHFFQPTLNTNSKRDGLHGWHCSISLSSFTSCLGTHSLPVFSQRVGPAPCAWFSLNMELAKRVHCIPSSRCLAFKP